MHGDRTSAPGQPAAGVGGIGRAGDRHGYADPVPYDPKLLYGDEKVIVDTHPHWIMLVGSVVSVLVATAVGIWLLTLGWEGAIGQASKILAVALIVAALAYLVHRIVKWYSTNFVITTDRCIYRSGILSKRGVEIPLERINTVFFHQHLLERLVRAGTLHVESAGELGIQRFEDVRDPVTLQNLLYQAMEDNENRKFDRIRQPAEAAAGPAAQPMSVADEIAKLAALRDQGHLTPEEFEHQKAVLLGRPGPPTA
jgi:uncharacterized membrane protein YdbT with pleckstrin-like domain